MTSFTGMKRDLINKKLFISRLETSSEKTTKMIVIPRYEPVFVEPNFKEYETQVREQHSPSTLF